jgi:hypothetical protein
MQGTYQTWPGLTPTLVAKYCLNAEETHKGHMAQPRQHVRSTQQPPTHAPQPAGPTCTLTGTSMLNITVIPITKIFMDDTGRFVPRARSGNQYLMITLHSPSNAILVQPFASKHDAYRIAAYRVTYAQLAASNATPTLHILDNEVSATFQHAITSNNCSFQLVPPHVHRRNAAKRAIWTFKDHFLAILAGVAPTLPWD